jgi:hypothetical protein
MKPVKIAALALMGTLAWGSHSLAVGKGGPEFMALNVSLTVQQQALSSTNKNGDGKTYIWTIEKAKLNNKALLAYMAEMFNTNWPADARLMYSAYAGEVVVTDKTGTNVLFYCGTGVNDTNRYAYVHINWRNYSGPAKGKYVEDTPGSASFTDYARGTIEIYYANNDDETVYADMEGDGLNIESDSSKWTDTTYTTWVKETFTPFAIGGIDEMSATLTGKITAKGKETFTKK